MIKRSGGPFLSKMSVSSFKGDLKGKSALMIFDRYANIYFKFACEIRESYLVSVRSAQKEQEEKRENGKYY